jgi:hypothetical protein
LFLMAAVITGATGGPGEAQDTLRPLLPADGAVPGWSRDGEPQEFAGEDLYTYIDGGAEIYHEYGFKRVVIQDYAGAAGRSVSLEVFEMADAAAAYGMFTFKRSGQGKAVPLGSAAELEDYYLNLWRGRFVATLTGFDSTAPTLDGLTALAAALDAKLGEGAPVPDLVAALPAEGLRPQSVKYLEGLLGLNNVYPFYTARGLGFARAVKGDYAGDGLLVVLDYVSAAAGAAAWTELRGFLEASDRFTKAAGADGAVALFNDGRGRCLGVIRQGARLVAAVGPSFAAVTDLASRAAR